jgi:hypothetical protein
MQVNRRYRFASDPEVEGLSAVSGLVVGRCVSPSLWFVPSHPLARVAAARCRAAGHEAAGRRGVVACGACWERAIRDDERFVVECDLPREVTVDPLYVDEVAVERACAGDVSVTLSRYEVWAAVARLQAQGLNVGEIAARLRRDKTVVRRILAGLAAGVAA